VLRPVSDPTNGASSAGGSHRNLEAVPTLRRCRLCAAIHATKASATRSAVRRPASPTPAICSPPGMTKLSAEANRMKASSSSTQAPRRPIRSSTRPRTCLRCCTARRVPCVNPVSALGWSGSLSPPSSAQASRTASWPKRHRGCHVQHLAAIEFNAGSRAPVLQPRGPVVCLGPPRVANRR